MMNHFSHACQAVGLTISINKLVGSAKRRQSGHEHPLARITVDGNDLKYIISITSHLAIQVCRLFHLLPSLDDEIINLAFDRLHLCLPGARGISENTKVPVYRAVVQ